MKKRILVMLLLAFTLLAQTNITAYAITTEFMVPDIATNRNFDNVLYASSNNNVMISKFSYGLVGDVLNTSNLDALISELNANANPSQYGNSIVGIYMEGAALSDANASALASAGWGKLEMYYEKFMISGSIPSRGMHPVIEVVNDESVATALTNAGFTGQAGVFQVSDISMTEPLAILYAPELNFLRGVTPQVYKYIPDIQKFVAGPTAMYDGYDRSFMDMEGLHLADGDPNGTFVALTESLPADFVITSEQIQSFRDQLQQEKEEPVTWTFVEGVAPENFTSEATVEILDEREVKVKFDYSGKLPEGTEVTIHIPDGSAIYDEGITLYFYYCNPETSERDFVSEGTLKEGKVTFDIEHCSEYIITSEKAESEGEVVTEVDIVEKGPTLFPIITVGVLATVGTAFVVYIVVKKRKAN